MNRFAFLSHFLFVLLSCTNPSPSSPLHSVPTAGRKETGLPALHAVRSGHLRELMQQMNNLMQKNFSSESEQNAEQHKTALQISSIAHDLSKTIDPLPSILPTLHLSTAEQTTFLALMSKLRIQTETLQEQAEQNILNVIPNTLEQMNTTCTSCHALFRVPKIRQF